MTSPHLSVVIPVYNEEESLPLLFARLMPVLENLNRPYEVVFINDGSRDRSLALLLDCRERYPGRVVVVDFNGNFGQHMAIMAGFSQARGEMIVTMDADLQNPPEEIPRILAEMEAGHDVVGTVRSGRQDPLFRKFASKIVNRISNRITGLKLNDYGCMMRGYNRRIINFINQCKETTTFIPALAQKFAMNPVEIPIAHSEREQGQSKYGLYRLIRLNFDLMTGFSLIPLQAVTMLGIIVSILSFLFSVFLLLRRLVVGPEVEGVFTLMAISFFLMGITLFSVGLVGEYIGRIYQEVRERPRFVIRKVWNHEG
ncbi:MAG TPA: glycosyltransferase [Synergistales bacterium]|nr:glycosyltransferase [Synergistales bacterium]